MFDSERKRSIPLITMITIALLIPILYIQTSNAQTPFNPPVIKGMVTGENGMPIPRAEIIVMKYQSTETVGTATTGSDGFFVIENLPPVEKYHLWIQPALNAGYPGQYWDQETNCTSPPRAAIYLHEEAIFTVHIKLLLNPPEISNPPDNYFGAIEGKIFDETGAILPDIRVAILEPASQTPVDYALTDQEGKFVLLNVPSNCPHYLVFQPPSNTTLPVQFFSPNGTTINPFFMLEVDEFNTLFIPEIKLSQNPDTVNDDTTSNATIEIMLYDSTGGLVYVDGYVTLYSDQGSYTHYLDPDSLIYPIEFNFLPSGDYSIQIFVANYPPQYYSPDGNTVNPLYRFWISENQTMNFEIKLTKNPSDNNNKPNIVGHVKNEYGRAVPNTNIYAFEMSDISQHMMWISTSHIWSNYSTVTDSAGNYELYNIHPGNYVLIAQKENEDYVTVFFRNALNFNKAETIPVVSSTDVKSADFILQKGTRVSGYVKDERQNGIENIRVSLYHDNESSIQSTFSYETESDANGRFILRGIPEGTWHVEVWDEEGMYYRDDGEYEDVVTSSTITEVQLNDHITMIAGGRLYGKYSLPWPDTMHYYDFATLFLYPEDISSVNNDSSNDTWEHMHIQLMMTDTAGIYRSSPIPAGNWRMIISPNQMHDMMDFQGNDFIPYPKWSYIDHATTLSSSAVFTITPYKEMEYAIRLDDGGYAMIGHIKGEYGELFGYDTLTGTQGKWFDINTYSKEGDHFVKIGKSYGGENNSFVITGLIDGQEYYFEAWAEDYRDQWWKTNDETDQYTTTCNRKKAIPYTFSTTNFTELVIRLMEKPEDHDQWQDEGPSAVKNFLVTPKSLSSFLLTWNRSPEIDNVVSYKIYRLKNPKADMFFINDHNYWEPVHMDSIMALLDSFMVRDTFFIDDDVDYNNSYMYVVAAVDIQGHEGHIELLGSKPITDYFTKMSYYDFTTVTEIKPAAWQMMGICGLDSLSPQSGIGTTDEVQLFFWDETADSSKLYSHYIPVTSLHPTKGAWIYSSVSLRWKMSEPAFNKLVNNKDNIRINLIPGWNQVSSPFPYEVSPSWLVQNYVAWEWISGENKYVEANTLKPWKAYWIQSQDSVNLPVPPTFSMAKKRGLSKLSMNAEWEITVSLVGENSSDPDNFIGTLPKDLEKSLNNTSPEPPQAFNFSHLYFVDGTRKLSKHFVFSSAIPEKKIEWKVGISPCDEAMSIIIHDIASIPEEISLFWVDNANTVNLREKNTVSLSAHSETKYGYIVATANPEDIALYIGKLMLRPNYPNPFRGYTTIEFTIPYFLGKGGSQINSDRQKVSLNIYNMAGQLVSTIYSGYTKAGRHRSVWDGKSSSGRIVPSGVYIARLKIADHTKTLRMFKVR